MPRMSISWIFTVFFDDLSHAWPLVFHSEDKPWCHGTNFWVGSRLHHSNSSLFHSNGRAVPAGFFAQNEPRICKFLPLFSPSFSLLAYQAPLPLEMFFWIPCLFFPSLSLPCFGLVGNVVVNELLLLWCGGGVVNFFSRLLTFLGHTESQGYWLNNQREAVWCQLPKDSGTAAEMITQEPHGFI